MDVDDAVEFVETELGGPRLAARRPANVSATVTSASASALALVVLTAVLLLTRAMWHPYLAHAGFAHLASGANPGEAVTLAVLLALVACLIPRAGAERTERVKRQRVSDNGQKIGGATGGGYVRACEANRTTTR
jgi:hypothetical protein